METWAQHAQTGFPKWPSSEWNICVYSKEKWQRTPTTTTTKNIIITYAIAVSVMCSFTISVDVCCWVFWLENVWLLRYYFIQCDCVELISICQHSTLLKEVVNIPRCQIAECTRRHAVLLNQQFIFSNIIPAGWGVSVSKDCGPPTASINPFVCG